MQKTGPAYDYILLCPKVDELNVVIDALNRDGRFKRVSNERSAEPLYIFGTPPDDKKLKCVTCGGMGHTKVALKAAAEIWTHDPKIIFLVGTAASLDPEKVQIGDVVIPRKSIYRFYDKISEEGQADYSKRLAMEPAEKFHQNNILCADLETIGMTPATQAAIAGAGVAGMKLGQTQSESFSIGGRIIKFRDPKILLDEDIISCGMVVDSLSYSIFLRGFSSSAARKITTIDMESFGFYSAIDSAKTSTLGARVEGMMIRGISDYAGRKEQMETKPTNWKTVSVGNAASVFIQAFSVIAAHG